MDKKWLKLPEIDLKELEEDKKRIMKEREELPKRFSEWMVRNPKALVIKKGRGRVTVAFPAIPGYSASAKTKAKAIEKVRQAIERYVAPGCKDGMPGKEIFEIQEKIQGL